ncbi:HD domain-containing protein [Vibrio jasicida]|uniref:HD domain-containing protein n=1 Tax=Vibrio jasicida TaxID=766224 RepID=A0AAU9QKI8_9VIBR|nr:HD domain-containing protein [Vibrio jasicida]CAH1596066.1 HD domain-containing protein [Vibrio jasicida]
MNSLTTNPNASGFLALAMRQGLIQRWPLMRTKMSDNLLEHGYVVSIISLMAGHLARDNGKNVDVLRMMAHGLLHDLQETVSQDISSLVKNATPEMAAAYAVIEDKAQKAIISTLPDDLRGHMAQYFELSGYEKELCKAADQYATYIKAVQEVAAGNHIEFADTLEKIEVIVENMVQKYPEMEKIHNYFNDGFDKSVDTLLGGPLFG